MKSFLALVFATVVSAASTGARNPVGLVTQVVQRIHYTCPCNGQESIVTSTSISIPGTTTTTSSSTPNISGTTITTKPSAMVTTTSSVPAISAGQPFAIRPQPLSSPSDQISGRLRKRAESYFGFTDNRGVLTTDSSSSWAFTITTAGRLVTYTDGYPVGSTSSTQSAVLQYFTPSDGSPAQTSQWSITDGVLTYPGASFCLTANNLLALYYTDMPTGCSPVSFVADSSPSDFNLKATPITTTSASSATTPHTVTNTSPKPSTTTGTTSATTTATDPSMSCVASAPQEACTQTVSSNSTSPQYVSKCNTYWSGTYWGSEDSFADCMASCDRMSQYPPETAKYDCVGFAYNAAPSNCGRSANCWVMQKKDAPTFATKVGPVGTVPVDEWASPVNFTTDVWFVALLSEYWT